MPTLALKAHWNGERVLLDEPCEIPLNAPLIVTVLPRDEEVRIGGWIDAAKLGLNRAFGDTEPDYSSSDVKP